MEITVISEEENPMLHRTDVQFRVSHAEATPDRLAVRDSLAARLNKNADEVVIRRLDTKFGMRETVGEAKVYQAPEFATDVEQVHMLARNKIGDLAEAELEAEAPDAEPATGDAEPAPEPDESADEGPEADAEESGGGADADAEEAEPGAEGDDEAADAPSDDDPGSEDADEGEPSEAADEEPEAASDEESEDASDEETEE